MLSFGSRLDRMDEATIQTAAERVGMNIRLARVERKWTQEQLALEAHISRADVSEVERGKLNVSLRKLIRIQMALGVPLAVLARGVGDE